MKTEKWNKIENFPKDGDDIIVYLEIKEPVTRKYNDMAFAYVKDGEIHILEGSTFDYPVNYWEGNYKITHWMLRPNDP